MQNWQNFSEHLQLMFKDLYEEGKHSDVTLVCDDQTQFKAHKIVLSACSPVFKNIIDNNPSQHPLIYLRGIQSSEMETILQFMYLGEGITFSERMEEFIKVAKDLEMKEIRNIVEMQNDEEQLDDKIFPDDETMESVKEDTQVKGKENIRTSKSVQCLECEALFSSKPHMLRHFRNKHEGIKYSCNQCDHQANTKTHLQTHIQSKHDGIRYPCNQCDFKASQKSSLQTHVQSKHEGIRYPCNLCDHRASQKGDLLKHIKSKHEGIKNQVSV